ncbi:DMT family transporter [Neptunomonas marina]|uniref:DMT family transporter n=1 Tax=Neptunomonas marina TaxID=1815562 RepID=A0A437QCU2_9GAMM|nr:DMT family transporter [Neptunomonas marina]RVU32213.1 DMT family transporter [Neptunomonas marina]
MSSYQDYLKGVALVLLATVCFSFQPIFGHLAHSDDVSVVTLIWLRFLISAVLLHLFLFRQTTPYWYRPFIIGVLFSFGSICYFSALRSLSVGLTTLLFFLFPVYIFLLSVLLKHESISWLKLLAVGIAAMGVWTSVEVETISSWPGLMMGLAAGASYGIYIMLSNHYLKHNSPFDALRWVTTGAAASLSCMMLWTDATLPNSWSGAGAAVGLSLVCTLMSMVFLLTGTRLIQRSSDVSVIASTEIGMTLFLAWLLLDSLISNSELVGAAMVFASALLIVVAKKQETRKALQAP